MKKLLVLGSFVGIIVGAIVAIRGLAGFPFSPNDPLRLRDMDQYVKITAVPFEMHDSTIAFCRPPDELALNPHEPLFPEAAFCDVYVNAIAEQTMLTGEGTYPEGSLIIKSKLNSVNDKKPELFTVMQKMPSGYDDRRGNWKYAVVEGKSFRPIAAGRIDSCIDCHESYAATDYVTRTYLQSSAAEPDSDASQPRPDHGS